MTNIYRNPSLDKPAQEKPADVGNLTINSEKVPPKANPIIDRVSVNGIGITEQAILAETQHHSADTPGEALGLAAQALVIRELLVQEANKLGLVANCSIDENKAMETEQDALIRQLIEREVDLPKATADECKRYYDNNIHKFSSETIYEASHILLAAPANKPDELVAAQIKASEICQLLRANPDRFGELAIEFSECPSREQGGNLGQLTKGSTVDEFEKALQAADQIGLIADPVQSRFGYHVIRLDRVIQGKTLPFEHVHESIAAWLEAKNWSKAVSQYIRILAGEAEIEGVSIEANRGPLID